ncbi:MAG: endonuclease/exonuclease/phosphatase family protein [Gemmobacter sp.]
MSGGGGKGRPELTVATYNIHKAVGSDFRRDPDRVLRVIAELGADVLALQEADRRFGERAAVLDPVRLREATGLEPVRLVRRLGSQALGWHGNLLLARPGLVTAARPLVLPALEPRGAILADLDVAGRPLRVVAAHLGLLAPSRRAQLRRIARWLDAQDDRPGLLLGDLNEWREGGDLDLAGARIRAPGRPATYPARLPLLPLDAILADRRLEVAELEPFDTPAARRASDHLPLRARVRL